jgi:uncharacterized membrane protein YhdT
MIVKSGDSNFTICYDGVVYFFVFHVKNDHTSFLRENWFEMSDLFSSLLIFTIIKTILSTFFYCFKILQKSCKMGVDRDGV